jgi:hypothetical protein
MESLLNEWDLPERLRIAQGGAKAEPKLRERSLKKVAALAEAQAATTPAALTGRKKQAIAKKTLGTRGGFAATGAGCRSKYPSPRPRLF